MNQSPGLISDAISGYTQLDKPVEVSMSHELVHLLSEQLYQSPLKAIEELVVNAYDADATECRVYVPLPSDTQKNFVVVFDNGIGMNQDGLMDLWQIGQSNKRNQDIESRRKRKQIGKFGIGKLAACAIANQLTYVSKNDGQILSVTVNFTRFSSSPTGATRSLELPVHCIDDWNRFVEASYMPEIFKFAQVDSGALSNTKSWTFAILEDLKPKARKITKHNLTWVLSTAMPLQNDFHLYLNGEEIHSSKEDYEKVVEFNLNELPSERINSLQKRTNEEWYIDAEHLKSNSFKLGVSGTVFITEKTLLGKSVDISRSHGFFVRVRGRLVNEGDSLFGLKPLIHETFNRFRADISADDLDDGLKASRDTIEESEIKEDFRTLLREVFNETAARYEDYKKSKPTGKPKEAEKEIVSPYLVEYPVADAIITQTADSQGTEADEGWFYLELDANTDLKALIQSLYTTPRSKYRYRYTQRGQASRLVKFNPGTSTFWINEDHALVREYVGESHAKRLLEDFVTAEALLEIYLRESRLPPHIVGEVLEQRDALLRKLVKDHSYALTTISDSLRDAAADENELEVNLVVAARALGFVATHISGSGEPDGIARFIDYPDGEKKITLEAKSSEKAPSLSQLDFAGLKRHVEAYKADGCLLVAPAYRGGNGENSAVAQSARQQKISCWTIEQLAHFVEAAESRQLTAKNLLNIVLKHFSPNQVTQAINQLLSQPTWDYSTLYEAILNALRELDGRLPDRPRTVDMIAAQVAQKPEFREIHGEDIENTIKELASSSQGGMTLREEKIIIHVSLDELERRLSGLTKRSTKPRRVSNFREDEQS